MPSGTHAGGAGRQGVRGALTMKSGRMLGMIERWVGGPPTKFDPGGRGQEFTGRLARPGELGQGGDSAFRPREARWRTKNGQRFKGFRAQRE